MKKAIVVEDNPGVMGFLKLAIPALGYKKDNGIDVYFCKDGQEAWDTYGAQKPVQLLLTDDEMPLMLGRELVKRVKEDDKGVAVIMMSGTGLPDEARPYVDRFMPKPVSIGDIDAIFRKYIAGTD